MALEYVPYTGPDPLTAQLPDGRATLEELFTAFNGLEINGGLEKRRIGNQRIYLDKTTVTDRTLPITGYRSPKTIIPQPALWLLAGVHGEEPAGPNAIAAEIDHMKWLERRGIPMVVLPMLNPAGYCRGQRYNNGEDSVTDADYLFARTEAPPYQITRRIFDWVLNVTTFLPPRLVVDLHEDTDTGTGPYLYTSGTMHHHGAPVAEKLKDRLALYGYTLQSDGKTRFGERIRNGIIQASRDGSIDDLLTSRRIVKEGKRMRAPRARAGIVAETRIGNIPLDQRVMFHRTVLQSLSDLWEVASK